MKGTQFKKIIPLILATGLFCSINTIAADGPSVGGGGDPNKISEASIQLLLEGGGLKNALLNYIKTATLKDVEDSIVRNKLTEMMANDQLIGDIQNSVYEVNNSCKDENNSSVPASTYIGNKGGKICFDAKRLARELKDASEEQVLIRLASLALHEHVHHFQKQETSSEVNEKEAYQVAAYMQLSAKIMQIPTLTWRKPRNLSDEEKKYEETHGLIDLPMGTTIVLKVNGRVSFRNGYSLGKEQDKFHDCALSLENDREDDTRDTIIENDIVTIKYKVPGRNGDLTANNGGASDIIATKKTVSFSPSYYAALVCSRFNSISAFRSYIESKGGTLTIPPPKVIRGNSQGSDIVDKEGSSIGTTSAQ